MKKIFAIFLSTMLFTTLFSGCFTTLGAISNAAKKNKAKKAAEADAKAIAEAEAYYYSIDFVSQLDNIVTQLLADVKNRPVFAFLPLKSDDGNSLVENYVTDALTEATFSTGKIKIVEKVRLDDILKELKFQNSGLVNEKTAKQIGQLSGAGYVCFGTVKDLNNKVAINVRVVEVESGVLFAMSHDTVEKDHYLFYEATNGAKNAGVVAKSVKKITSLWQVRKTRNDFDGCTTYTFTLKGSGSPFVFVGYSKYDNPTKSVVRSGVNWVKSYDTDGSYDFKGDDGDIITKKFSYAYWSFDTGWKDGNEKFAFTYNKGEVARFFINLFEKNNFMTIRHEGETFRFQTEGLWQIIEAQGITREEIDNAIANEEF